MMGSGKLSKDKDNKKKDDDNGNNNGGGLQAHRARRRIAEIDSLLEKISQAEQMKLNKR